MAESVIIFIISVGLNFIFRALTPYVGVFRRGFDTVVFCAITAGYIGGIKDGLLFGILIAVAYYLWRSKQWDMAMFVIPLAGLTGALAGIFNNIEYIQLGLGLFVFYHIISGFMIATVYKQMGFQYMTFITINFVTTFILLQIASIYLI